MSIDIVTITITNNPKGSPCKYTARAHFMGKEFDKLFAYTNDSIRVIVERLNYVITCVLSVLDPTDEKNLIEQFDNGYAKD